MNGDPQWYYRREGMIEDETVGPISEDDLVDLVRRKKLKSSTWVSSPQATKGQWVQLSAIDLSGALAKYDARLEQRKRQEEAARQQLEAVRQGEIQNANEQQRLRTAQELRLAQESAARQHQERARYLESVKNLQKHYKIAITDPHDSERVCNQMGFEGWELDQAFAETFSYQPCCGARVFERKFVLVFSQPMHKES